MPGEPDDGPTVDFAVCSFADDAVHLVRFTPRRRTLAAHRLPLRLEGAFALAAHPRLPLLYATALRSPGELVVLRRHETASAPAATEIARDVLPGLEQPCRITVDPRGGYLVLAGYGSGSVARVTLDARGMPGAVRTLSFVGSGPDADRQDRSHLHDAIIDDTGILSADLGADVLRVLTGTDDDLVAVATATAPAGSGPRHITAVGDGRFAVSGELDSSLMLFTRRGPELTLAAHVPSTGIVTGERNYPSTVVADRARRLVHVANRGADTVVTAAVEDDALRVEREVSSGGVRPEHLALTEEHLLVATSGDGAVTALRLRDGIPTGEIDARVEIPGAVWIERL